MLRAVSNTSTMTDKKVLHVAVGLIMLNQQVLISWRNASQHQGNRYEFPGGKIEVDETPEQGLIRELREELGIEVQHPIRAQQLCYDYPEKTVCLHVFKVTQFSGEPRGHEGQHIRWVAQQDLAQYQFPDANTPILRVAQCPEQYLISYEQTAGQSLTDWLNFHVQHVPERAWLYVRHHQLGSDEYQQVIEQLSQARPDLQLVGMYRHISAFKDSSIQLAGVHYTKQDLSEASLLQTTLQQTLSHQIVPPAWLRFAACKTEQDIQAAQQLSMDAIILGPVNATLTHPEASPLGWQEWQQLCLQSNVPVYALGGVTKQDVLNVQQYGGFALAGIRGFYPE